ncbi:MAG: hypothetical protein GYB26_01405 [Gammaproteobacteria bacterium]|uniref:Uncharacterized protein n=1 Tax=Marinobacter litoralis TaxID=187981 RepID=A0A3M2RJI7_9GAMM|nr:hypothetical protein [Marinobacter litoralis]MBR9869776.1 hypothetical protein [Gammaproteobacteria bacterium]RMJ05490.1 hypothetical protein DOQ08_00160 [Marinobacter litoralis]
MIIRIFLLLLALNSAAFVASAEAAEPARSEPLFSDRMMAEREEAMSAEDMYELQEWMSGDEQDDHDDALAAIGSRLLSLSFSRKASSRKKYASDPAQPDHGIALLNEGACLNLRWMF